MARRPLSNISADIVTELISRGAIAQRQGRGVVVITVSSGPSLGVPQEVMDQLVTEDRLILEADGSYRLRPAHSYQGVLMEPDVAEDYDRLMNALQEAVEEDPESDRTMALRQLVAAFLREHIGKVTQHPSAASESLH